MILNSDEIKMPKRPRQNGRISALCAKPWLERVAVCGGVRCSVFAFVSVVETFEVLSLWWMVSGGLVSGWHLRFMFYRLEYTVNVRRYVLSTENIKYKI